VILMMDEYWRDRKVLVTGATGILGSAMVRQLIAGRADVVCIVRDWVPESDLLRKNINVVKIANGLITDQKFVERVIAEYEVDTVFHLAAQAIVKVADASPISTFDTNIRGTWTVLEACRRNSTVKSIVVASSDKAYGHQELPYTEDMPLEGMYPYDVSKSCTDMIAQSYAATYKLPVAITRCGNFYGAGDLNWNRIIPGTIRSILRGCRPVIRSDGTTIRDYLYVDDAVEGYLILARYLLEYPHLFYGEAFNFSTETPTNTEEVVRNILKIMKSDLEPDIRNESKNEIKEQWLSAEKARRMLNWYPKHTLVQGLQKTIEWYREFLK
jgi:CDP-glucose 4,6-dehydratase